MKILFLCNKLPHAEVRGGHRIIFQRIRHLAEAGHEVGLLTFIDGEPSEALESLNRYLSGFFTVPFPHRNILKRIFHDYIALSRPAVFWKSYSKEMTSRIGQVVEAGQYDVVIAEFSEMGQYLYKNPYLPAVNKIISCHRCVSESYEKYNDLNEVRLRLYLKSIPQLRGLEKYEFELYRNVNRILVLTPSDRVTMQYYASDLSISIATSGVDVDYLQKIPAVSKEAIILMTGFMGDPANDDGVQWFYHHMWPQLRERNPEIKFYIVGAGPSKRMQRMAKEDDRIVVTGGVEDLRVYRNRARVFVSPVRLGSGMRIKVLEAMAGGVPIVSTSLGMSGIDAQTGVNCLIADTPDLFCQSIERLFTDSALSARISRKAQQLVESKHRLETGLENFEKIVKSVVES